MTAIAHHPHRVTRAMAGVRDQLAAVAGVPLWSMDATETTTAISEVQQAEAQLAELEARLVAQAEALDIPGRSGATSTATWLAHHTKTTRAAAHRTVRLAAGLESHDQTRDALAEGRVHVEQAEAILRALDDLPADLDPSLVQDAEAHLLAEAEHFDARALKRFGRRLLEVVAPDAADAHEAQLFEREERDAAGRHPAHDVGGRTRQGPRPVHPRHPHRRRAQEGPPGLRRPQAPRRLGPARVSRQPGPERLGRAFTELIHRYPTKDLPKAGGVNATVVVTMTLDTLLGGLKAARLDTGESISPPARLGGWPARPGSSPPSSAGSPRSSTSAAPGASTPEPNGSPRPSNRAAAPPRAATGHPASATCTTRSPGAAAAAPTTTGCLLCPRHHARAHDPTYTTTHLPGGKVAFTRRT